MVRAMLSDAVQEAVPGAERGEEMAVARLGICRWLGRGEKRSAKAAGVRHPRYVACLLSIRSDVGVVEAMQNQPWLVMWETVFYTYIGLGARDFRRSCPCSIR